MSIPVHLPSIGNQTEGAIAVEVDLLNEHREAAVVIVWAPTAGEAVMNAEDYADERLGGDWAMNDWRPVS